MRFDIWYSSRTLKDVAYAGNVTFYPETCQYRGHLFTESGQLIGDFVADNSVIIEKHFPGIFGNN